MSLYGAELRRLRKRRFVRYFALAGLLLLTAIAVGTFVTNQKVGPTQIAAAQADADRDYQQQVTWAAEERAQCEAANAAGRPDPNRWPADCSEITPPPRGQIQLDWFLPPTFDFRSEFDDMIIGFAAIMVLVAFVAGASFVGAEWNSGGMMNLLLWRPRRIHVLATKLTALLTSLTAFTVLTAAVWTVAFWFIATYRGITDGMTPGVWQSFGLTGLRALALILVAGAVGFALASLGRHTAMALGVAIGVIVVGQYGLGLVLLLARVPFFEAYLVPVWAMAWMNKKYTVVNEWSCEASTFGGCEPATFDITWQMSGGAMAAAVVLVVGAALWTMRSRDIT